MSRTVTGSQVWSGTTDANVQSKRFIADNRLGRFTLINKGATTITVAVRLGDADEEGTILQTPKGLTLANGEMYVDGNKIINDRNILYVETTGPIDYEFLFDRTYPDGLDGIPLLQAPLTGITKSSNGSSTNNEVGGTAIFSGTGDTLYFDILHGLGYTPTAFSVTAASLDAQGIADTSTEVDSTKIRVFYNIAPNAGVSNVSITWTAQTI